MRLRTTISAEHIRPVSFAVSREKQHMASQMILYAAVCCPVLFAALAFIGFTAYLFFQHRRYRHIPGPPRDNFFLGNVPYFLRRKAKGIYTHEVWHGWQRTYGPVFVFWVFHVPVVFVSDSDTIKTVLVTRNLPKSARIYGKIAYVFGARCAGNGVLTETNHVAWQRKRSTLNPAFHRKYLRNLMEAFNSSCDDLIEKLRGVADGTTEVHMADEFARVTLDIIGKVGFDININTVRDPHSPFPSAITQSLAGIEQSYRDPLWMLKVPFFPYYNSVRKSITFLRTFAEKVIRKRAEALENGDDTPPDILAHLLSEKSKNSHITMEDLVDDFLTLFIAGQETTSNHLSFTLYEILKHPEIENRMLHEIDETLLSRRGLEYEDLSKLQYMDQVLKESLRLHVPIGGTRRILHEASNFCGYHIPGGTAISIAQYTLHKIPEYWNDPEVFDPERFSPGNKEQISNFVYFPFSVGPRTCIGKTLAKFESKVVMAKLLQEFEFKLMPGQTANIEENVTIRPRDGVVCTLTRRK